MLGAQRKSRLRESAFLWLVDCLDSSFIYYGMGILPAFSSWIEHADAQASSSFCFNPL
jgi:hypothetical protein